MSCKAERVNQPVADNICGPENEIHKIQNFCGPPRNQISITTRAKLVGDFCKVISPEWDYFKVDGDYVCLQSYKCYPGCEITGDFQHDCSYGCSVNVGLDDGVCQRKVFSGKPLPCCFQDHFCTNNRDKDSFCFTGEGDERKETCAPEFRNLTQGGCQNLIKDYCGGEDIDNSSPDHDLQDLILRWTGLPNIFNNQGKKILAPCYGMVWRNVYEGQAGSCSKIPNVGVPDEKGFVYVKNILNNLMQQYFKFGGQLIPDGFSVYDREFTFRIWTICNTYPGLCQDFLGNYCAQKTTNQLIRDPTLLPWCGCYMADNEYSKYTNLYDISKECTPTCNVVGVIPLSTSNGIGIKKCELSTCIIDDISIKIYESKVGTTSQGITFSQICPSCSTSSGLSCNCNITGNTIDVIESQIPTLSLKQNCGTTSLCSSESVDDNGIIQTIRVPCLDSTNPLVLVEEQNKKIFDISVRNRNLTMLIIVIIILIIIIIIWIIIQPNLFSS